MLRRRLVEVALKYGVAPSITSSVSEYDAAMLLGMTDAKYSKYMRDKTAVTRGYDFVYNGVRYQIKATRPSGKPGSKITKVPNAKNYNWDRIIWVLYDKDYVVLEAWEWDVDTYKAAFRPDQRLSPSHYRQGKCLYQKNS